MKSIYYILVIVLLVGGMIGVEYYTVTTHPAVITHEAAKPSTHLVNTKRYLKEKAYQRSLSELKQGITEIEGLLQDISPESTEIVKESLSRLRKEYDKAVEGDISKDSINDASVNMLLVLTRAQVKAADLFLKEDNLDACKKSIKYAMIHIKNALQLSDGDKKHHEIEIYSLMNEIMNDDLTRSEIQERLDMIHRDLSLSLVSFHK